MSLEQELVFQEINEGKDRQHLLDTIEALRELDVKVDSSKIETALKRHELLQEYERDQKKDFKTIIRKKVERLTEKTIKELEEDPHILSVILQKDYREICFNCSSLGCTSVGRSAKITYITGGDESHRHLKEWGYFGLYSYCEHCGNIKKIKDVEKLFHL